MYSLEALKLYTLQNKGLSNAAFWRDFSNSEKLSKVPPFPLKEGEALCLVCAFDELFPHPTLPLCGQERPYLFCYRGDISLLKNIERNVAVIGVLNPSKETIERERKIVKHFTERGFTIVSGLARGVRYDCARRVPRPRRKDGGLPSDPP